MLLKFESWEINLNKPTCTQELQFCVDTGITFSNIECYGFSDDRVQEELLLLCSYFLASNGQLFTDLPLLFNYFGHESSAVIKRKGRHRILLCPNKLRTKSPPFSILCKGLVLDWSIHRPFSLFSHQERALSVWKAMGHRCLWAHDMGLGKTYTFFYIIYLNMFLRKYPNILILTLASILPKYTRMFKLLGIPFTQLCASTPANASGVVIGSFNVIRYRSDLKTCLWEQYRQKVDVPTDIFSALPSASELSTLSRVKAWESVAARPEVLELKARVVKAALKKVPILERFSVRFSPGHFGLVVVDESHSLNNGSNLATKLLTKIITPETHVLFGSGTPFGNGYVDAFPQMNILSPGLLGSSQQDFNDKWCRNISRNPNYSIWEFIPEREGTIKSLIYSKSDFQKIVPGIELPPFREDDLEYTLSKEQRRLLYSIRNKYVLPIPDAPDWLKQECPDGIPITSAGLLLHLSRMICSGVIHIRVDFLGKTFEYSTAIPTAKDELLLDILDGTPPTQQVIVWFEYIKTGDRLFQLLQKRRGSRLI